MARRREDPAVPLEQVPRADDHGALLGVVESPQGGRNKLKYVPDLGRFQVSTVLPAGMAMPFDFGFMPRTVARDGDPLDVLILMDGPAYPGVLVPIRLLGVIEAEQCDDGDHAYRNDRLIAIATESTERGDLRRLRDLDSHLLDQIESFFVTKAGLEGKTFTPTRRRGPRTARRLLDQAHRAWQDGG